MQKKIVYLKIKESFVYNLLISSVMLGSTYKDVYIILHNEM